MYRWKRHTNQNATLTEGKTKAVLCRCLDVPRGQQVNAYQPSSEETILINIRPIWLSPLDPEGRIFSDRKDMTLINNSTLLPFQALTATWHLWKESLWILGRHAYWNTQVPLHNHSSALPPEKGPESWGCHHWRSGNPAYIIYFTVCRFRVSYSWHNSWLKIMKS